MTTRYGLILPIQRRDAGLDVLLEELGEEVLAAEQAGFDAVFLTEFHQAHGGALVSPLLVLAWLGARTTTIKLGTLVLAGPLHDPARLAEDVLMLDWATRGRVILGLGTAHMPPDFALYGRPREHRGAILDELMDVMEACWSNAPFEYDGRFFQRRGHVTPAPYTQPRPPVWIGAHGPKGLRRAAERADAWVCDPQRDIDTVAKLADEYRSCGGEQVVLFREGWIGEDAEEVWAPHAMKVHRLYYNVGVYPWLEKADLTLDRMAPDRFLFGSPDEVRATAADWIERTGANYIALRLRHPTGPTHDQTLSAIERLGRELVKPKDALTPFR